MIACCEDPWLIREISNLDLPGDSYSKNMAPLAVQTKMEAEEV